MSSLVMRALGALLTALGLAAVVVGGWFMTQLGTAGEASFAAAPGSRVVVLDPSVLNRVDSSVTVEATSKGGPVWMGLARPSDVQSVVKDAEVTRVSGVGIRDWTLRTATTGSGTTNPQGYDLWQAERTGDGTITTTVEQAAAPQTLVVAADEGQTIDSVTMRVADEGWFTRALVLTVVGALLLVAGAILLLRPLLARRSSRSVPGDEERPAREERDRRTGDDAPAGRPDDPAADPADDTSELDEGYLRAVGKAPRTGSSAVDEEDHR